MYTPPHGEHGERLRLIKFIIPRMGFHERQSIILISFCAAPTLLLEITAAITGVRTEKNSFKKLKLFYHTDHQFL